MTLLIVVVLLLWALVQYLMWRDTQTFPRGRFWWTVFVLSSNGMALLAWLLPVSVRESGWSIGILLPLLPVLIFSTFEIFMSRAPSPR